MTGELFPPEAASDFSFLSDKRILYFQKFFFSLFVSSSSFFLRIICVCGS